MKSLLITTLYLGLCTFVCITKCYNVNLVCELNEVETVSKTGDKIESEHTIESKQGILPNVEKDLPPRPSNPLSTLLVALNQSCIVQGHGGRF